MPHSFSHGLKKRISFCSILLAIISGFIHPGDAMASFPGTTWRPLVALGAGFASPSNLGKSQYVPIQNPITDEFYHYFSNHSSSTSPLWNIFLGTEWNLNSGWLAQTGLEFNATSSPFSINGTLVQGADVQSADYYNWHYQVLTQQILIDGKLLYTFKKHYHPYFMGGLGAAFNNAYNYQTSVPFNLTFTRMYLNNTNASFSYLLGLGIDFDLTSQVRVGVAYRYAQSGKIQLGNAFIDTTRVPGTLSQSNTYTNQLLGQLAWVFN